MMSSTEFRHRGHPALHILISYYLHLYIHYNVIEVYQNTSK